MALLHPQPSGEPVTSRIAVRANMTRVGATMGRDQPHNSPIHPPRYFPGRYAGGGMSNG